MYNLSIIFREDKKYGYIYGIYGMFVLNELTDKKVWTQYMGVNCEVRVYKLNWMFISILFRKNVINYQILFLINEKKKLVKKLMYKE